MKAGAASRPLLQAVAAAAGLSSTAAMAAEWTLAPSAQVYTQSQQNPRLASESKEMTTAFGGNTSLRMQRRTEQLQVSIQPTFGFQRYKQERDLDRTDQQLDTSLSWQGEHIGWQGSAVATRDTTATSELGTTGLTQTNDRHEAIDVSVGPTWQLSERLGWGSSLAWQLDRYPGRANEALVDNRYTTASTSLVYSYTDRISLSLVGSAGRLSSGSLASTDNAAVRVQGRYSLSSLWMINLAAGPSWVRAEQGATERGVVYSGDLVRRFERASLSLGASRSQSPSGRGVLTEVEEASLGGAWQISERLSGTLTVAMSRRKDVLPAFNADLQSVTYGHADAGLSWRFASSWQFGASLGNSAQKAESFLGEQGTARGYYARVSLGWTGNPYVN